VIKPDIDRYLSRIGIDRRLSPTYENLCLLHRAHMFSIPYENLDVQLGQPIAISIAPIFDKIVTRRRGGFCYEMNGIFGWALNELGFRATRATGAVMRQSSGDGQIANHLIIRVDLPESIYLADVGFGDGPLEPQEVRARYFEANGFEFRIEQLDRKWWRLHNQPFSGAKSFDFNLELADEDAFEEKSTFLQTAPNSLFVQNLVCFRHRPRGFDALVGRALRAVTPQGVETRILDGPEDLVEVLSAIFTLDVPAAASLWPKICARHEVIMAQAEAGMTSPF